MIRIKFSHRNRGTSSSNGPVIHPMSPRFTTQRKGLSTWHGRYI